MVPLLTAVPLPVAWCLARALVPGPGPGAWSLDLCGSWTCTGARWPSGLERWLVQATGLSWPGSNPTAENFASELWQFRLPRFASVFRRRH